MAELSRFFGIVIAMFYREHGRAHIHAYYSGKVAVIAVHDGELLSGRIPRPELRLVREWILLHRDELLVAWSRARAGRSIGKIRPLR